MSVQLAQVTDVFKSPFNVRTKDPVSRLRRLQPDTPPVPPTPPPSPAIDPKIDITKFMISNWNQSIENFPGIQKCHTSSGSVYTKSMYGGSHDRRGGGWVVGEQHKCFSYTCDKYTTLQYCKDCFHRYKKRSNYINSNRNERSRYVRS